MTTVFLIRALVAMFTVVDPVGLIPVVLGLTAGMSHELRRQVIWRAVIVAGAIIAAFGLFGPFIFTYLGVTPEAFSIAGGALLFLVAIDMLFGRQSGTRETPREAREARHREDMSVAVFPLAIPMIAGPGTITTIILLVGDAAGNPVDLASVAVATVLTLAAALVLMLVSSRVQKRISTTGILVLSRVLGMLLAAVALQFILNGVALYVQRTLR